MTVQTDLKIALDAYINSGVFAGALPEISAEKRNLEELLEILDSVTASGGGGGSSDITTNTSIEYNAGATTAKTQRVAIANDANTVTANAGTNLNTSLLAAESGGNLAGINTKLPANLGAKTAANSLAVTLSTDGVASGISTQIGEVQATPTANSVLARLKSIGDALVFGIKTAANSISITPASDAVFTISKVKELVAATQTHANTTPYSIGDSYGGRGVFTSVGTVGQSLFVNDFQVIIDITAIPASMSISVRFFTTEADTLVSGSPVSDNSLLTATLPNAATPADGYPLTLSVVGDKVIGTARNIKFLTPLEATSIWFYFRCNTAFTSAANSETMTAKASCEVY